jgi:hypothetical protein
LKKGGDQSLKQQIDRVRLARQVRLRQVTSHPFTIEKIIQERFREDDIVGVQRAHNKAKSIIPILESLKDGDKGSHGLMRFKAGMYHLETLKDDVFGGNFDMKALFDLTLSEANIRGIACGLCKKAKPPVKPVRSSEVSTTEMRVLGPNNSSANMSFARAVFSKPLPVKREACIKPELQ